MAGMNTQEDSEEEGDRIQSKKGRGKSKKGKKVNNWGSFINRRLSRCKELGG